MKKSSRSLLTFGIVLLGAVVGLRFLMGGHVAPKPGMFASNVTFEQAIAQSGQSGKPVFAFVTADWCGPCQHFKREALSDSRVTERVTSATIPVYIDSDAHPDIAERLGVQGIPMVAILRDGEIIGKQTGAVSAENLLAWLDTTLD